MKKLLFLFVFSSFTGFMSAQVVSERPTTTLTPREMMVKLYDNHVRGLQEALINKDASTINNHYGELLMLLRNTIQHGEVNLPKDVPASASLARQREILVAFEGFEFSQSTAETAAAKWLLLNEFGVMLNTK